MSVFSLTCWICSQRCETLHRLSCIIRTQLTARTRAPVASTNGRRRLAPLRGERAGLECLVRALLHEEQDVPEAHVELHDSLPASSLTRSLTRPLSLSLSLCLPASLIILHYIILIMLYYSPWVPRCLFDSIAPYLCASLPPSACLSTSLPPYKLWMDDWTYGWAHRYIMRVTKTCIRAHLPSAHGGRLVAPTGKDAALLGLPPLLVVPDATHASGVDTLAELSYPLRFEHSVLGIT